jgi:hypothetical protein
LIYKEEEVHFFNMARERLRVKMEASMVFADD